MNEFTIDEATGLPQLPEGYWWEIGKDTMDTDRIWLMTRELVREYRKKPIYGKGLKFWKVVEERETEEFDTVENYIHVYNEAFTFRLHSDRDKSNDTHPDFCEYIETFYASYTTWERYQVPISPEGIQYLAEKIWVKLQKDLEKKAKEDALEAGRKKYYGKYPPKSLDD
jgi:hypothetical protein